MNVGIIKHSQHFEAESRMISSSRLGLIDGAFKDSLGCRMSALKPSNNRKCQHSWHFLWHISLYASIFGHVCIHISMYVFVCFETGSYYVIPAGLELTVLTRMILNSPRPACHPGAGIKVIKSSDIYVSPAEKEEIKCGFNYICVYVCVAEIVFEI